MRALLAMLWSTAALIAAESHADKLPKVFQARLFEFEEQRVSPAVRTLIRRLSQSDLNQFLLSEDKGSRWILTKVEVLKPNLVSIELTDGNGAETILCEMIQEEEWMIIRRSPDGDWKSGKSAKDREAAIPLSKTKAQQDAARKPSTAVPE